MRKVCKRKHYDTTTSPLDYVLNGMLPARIASPITTVRIKNHSALKAIVTGKAVFNDIDSLVSAFKMAQALAHLGVGAEYMVELQQASQVMLNLQSRGGLTGPEINALNLGLEVHDAQLDDSRTTVALLEQALNSVKKSIRISKQKRKEKEAA